MPNMPDAAHGVALLEGVPVCLGQHTNICLGRPLTDPARIPSLCQENGEFKSSRTYREAYKRGEEFVVLLADTPLQGASQFAERLRMAIEQLQISHEQLSLQCSVSVGVACIRTDMANHQALIEAADKALYQAKSAGRNQVVTSP